MPTGVIALLEQIERYYDTVPRSSAAVEQWGGLTLFVSAGGFPFYARPRRGSAESPTAETVEAVRGRQRQLGVPEAFEWVHELCPALTRAVTDAGMTVYQLPLMIHRDVSAAAQPPDDVELRMIEPDDDALPGVQAAIGIGFAAPGTTIGEAGDGERAAATDAAPHDDLRRRIALGETALGGAFGPAGPVAGGSYSPRSAVAEITGVATLPAYRRRGIGAALTALLVTDARRSGSEVVFLSAGSDDVARVYAQTGFQRIGTACIAGAASA